MERTDIFQNNKCQINNQMENNLITGETRDEAIDRYRQIFVDWEKLSMAERRDRLNKFRSGIK